MDAAAIKREIITYGKLCYDKGLVSAAGGNISMRLGGRYFITATNESFRSLEPDSIVEVDKDGNLIEGAQGKLPSKEKPLHLAVYRERPEVDSVIHVHPVYSIAPSAAGIDGFPLPTVSSRAKLRKVGMVPCCPAGSQELTDAVVTAVRESEPFVKAHVMAEHGILVYESGMKACYDLTELMEETAKINYLAGTLRAAHFGPGAPGL